jgi:hypothetical protein
MAESSSAYADSGAISDLEQLCDEEDFDSAASTTSGGEDCKIETQRSPSEEPAVSKGQVQQTHTAPTPETQLTNSDDGNDKIAGLPTTIYPVPVEEPRTESKSSNLLDLPVDLLQDIIKEVCTSARGAGVFILARYANVAFPVF